MRDRQEFNAEALAALEEQKRQLTEPVPVVVTEPSYSEVLELKRGVFNAVCRKDLSSEQREQAFRALTG